MSINARAKVILAKKETTYGTDATPAAATDAIMTRNFQSFPIEVDTLERNLDLPTVGGSPVANTGKRQRVTFEVEIAGSGTPTTPAPWAVLLQGCGMGVPTPDTSDVSQAMGSAPWASLSLYHFYENQRRRMLGARGTFGANFTAGAYPYWTFEFTGLLPSSNPFDTQSPGTPDWSAFKEPVEVNTDNTTFTLDGYAAVMRSLEFSAGVSITPRRLVGAEYINRGNHVITGTIVMEAPLVATKNYFSTLVAGSQVALALTHGTQAGNIVELQMPHVQITSIADSEEDDVLMYTVGFRANVSAGNDDILIITS